MPKFCLKNYFIRLRKFSIQVTLLWKPSISFGSRFKNVYHYPKNAVYVRGSDPILNPEISIYFRGLKIIPYGYRNFQKKSECSGNHMSHLYQSINYRIGTVTDSRNCWEWTVDSIKSVALLRNEGVLCSIAVSITCSTRKHVL